VCRRVPGCMRTVEARHRGGRAHTSVGQDPLALHRRSPGPQALLPGSRTSIDMARRALVTRRCGRGLRRRATRRAGRRRRIASSCRRRPVGRCRKSAAPQTRRAFPRRDAPRSRKSAEAQLHVRWPRVEPVDGLMLLWDGLTAASDRCSRVDGETRARAGAVRFRRRTPSAPTLSAAISRRTTRALSWPGAAGPPRPTIPASMRLQRSGREARGRAAADRCGATAAPSSTLSTEPAALH
jgi:hypothetical protein